MPAPIASDNATHVPCCSAHGIPMACARYRRTHFVEVRPCCSTDAAAMKAEAEARFEALVMAGPIVDNASDRLWGPNGEPDDQPDIPVGVCGYCGGHCHCPIRCGGVS